MKIIKRFLAIICFLLGLFNVSCALPGSTPTSTFVTVCFVILAIIFFCIGIRLWKSSITKSFSENAGETENKFPLSEPVESEKETISENELSSEESSNVKEEIVPESIEQPVQNITENALSEVEPTETPEDNIKCETFKKNSSVSEVSNIDSNISMTSNTINEEKSIEVFPELHLMEIVEDCFRAYEYFFVKVFIPDDIVSPLPEYKSFVKFKKEPDNAYDSTAIAVLNDSTHETIGYLTKGKIKDMVNDYLDRDDLVMSRVDSIKNGEITLYIAFYKKYIKSVSGCKKKTFSLTGLSKKDSDDEDTKRYENLDCCSCGDLLTLDYDIFDEKYTAYNYLGHEVGEISKSVSENILNKYSEQDYHLIAEIVSLESKSCKIALYF